MMNDETRKGVAGVRGSVLARNFFAKRGKGQNVEVHLSEAELAALLAAAFELGLEAGQKDRGS